MSPKSCRDVSIHTFGSTRERTQSCEIVNVGINTKEGPPLLFKLLTVPLICSQVSAVPVEFCHKTYNYLNSLELADTPDGEEAELLVGSDYYWTVVTGEVELMVQWLYKQGWDGCCLGEMPQMNFTWNKLTLSHMSYVLIQALE